MEKKLTIILEIIIFIVAAVIIVVKDVIPETKKNFGSSDKFINTNIYQNMFEIDIDNNVRFSYIVNKNGEVYHMFFFDMNSTCLYNASIEGNKINDALLNSIKILIENDYLKNTSIITVTRYGELYNNEFMNYLKNNLSKYGIINDIIIKDSSLEKLCEELELEYEKSIDSYLRELDLYSKEITRVKKNNISNHDDDTEYIRVDNAREYTNNVYKKIEKYVIDNNIKSLDKYDSVLPITSIPADKDLKYYPSPNSWYYVKDGKVFAYIEIIDSGNYFGYCYNGSIDLNKKGEC